MNVTLNNLSQRYLDDAEWQAYTRKRTSTRDASLPRLREVTQRFVHGEIDLRTCRDQLDTITREQEHWGRPGIRLYGLCWLLGRSVLKIRAFTQK